MEVEVYDLLDQKTAQNPVSNKSDNRPLNILMLFVVSIILWGFTIGVYKLLIAGLSSIQLGLLDYISLL